MIGRGKMVRGSITALFGTFGLLLFTHQAEAKKKKTLTASEIVDPGLQWWCSDEICRRSESECENKITDYDDGDCTQQAKAAVVTAFSVMKDGYVYWVSPSSSQCKAIRKGVDKDEDYTELSSCAILGAVAYAPITTPYWWSMAQYFSSRALYCDYFGSCVFERAACKDSDVCLPQAEIYSYFSSGDTFATGSIPRWFSSKKQCDTSRETQSYFQGVSECTVLKARPVAMDSALIPVGKDWQCHDSASTFTMDYGNCYRTAEDCEAGEGIDKKIACAAVKRVWAYTSEGEFYAFSDERSCDKSALLAGDKTTSYCSRI